MSAYPPPNEDLPIFNPVDFNRPNIALTINDAKDYFLEYPTAQGQETLSSIIVNGSSVFNDEAEHNDLVVINQPTSTLNTLELINDNPGYSITSTARTSPGTSGLFTLTGSSSVNKENPIVEATDSVISSSINGAVDTGSLTLTQKSTTIGSGIRLTNNKVFCYGNLEIENGDGGNTGGITFPDGSTQTTSFTPNTPDLNEILTEGNTAGANNIDLNNNNLQNTNSVVFGDGTTQTTAYVGQSIQTTTSTSASVNYDANTNLTSYTFTSGLPITAGSLLYSAYEWFLSTPIANQQPVVFTQLGSTPPFTIPSPVVNNGSFIYATGIGITFPYQATSSTMLTYCAGFQQLYDVSTSGYAMNLSNNAIQGTNWNSAVFVPDTFTEDVNACPPTGSPPGNNTGTLVIRLEGNTTANGNATIKFIQTI